MSDADVSHADAAMRSAALAAALAEVQQWGVDRFSIEGVAHRGHIEPDYIRKTWASDRQLILDSLRDYSESRITLPNTGSLHGDLVELALAIGAYLNDPVGRRIARMFVVDSRALVVDSDIRVQFWLLRRTIIGEIFDRAAGRGELRDDAKPLLTLQLLTSPLHTFALYTDQPVDPDFCRAIADLVARAISV
ncbi:TetR-like C-terminal domain-containing protein [Mycolicibacterium pyrenivorans]|uniref:TetR-like C-terminal domain-containing protein n=1 Tax=Mycolicibacterium pyrenivorans TaxID=187102 RepID=UPI0021F373D5|nr:TetR-like C-terminal domain-containing protein [Mycolicibacterium pyrenivorans]